MYKTISKIRALEKPSKFNNGTWKIYQVKFEGDEQVYELRGFGKAAENFKPGAQIRGFITTRSWNGGSNNEFNKINAEYVYDLLEKAGLVPGSSPKQQDAVDEWDVIANTPNTNSDGPDIEPNW